MNHLTLWGQRHGISHQAMVELYGMFGHDITNSATPASTVTSEAAVSKQVRLAHAHSGGMLWRNNVGAYQDERGVWVRYGIANESKEMNRKIKSSDLIGITPLTITAQMVGYVIGQFTAIETKAPGWKFTGTEREIAQQKFLELVTARGGIGRFSTGE